VCKFQYLNLQCDRCSLSLQVRRSDQISLASQKAIIPHGLKYRSIELETHIQLPAIEAGDFFGAGGEPQTLLPIGYENTSEWVESFAEDVLKDSHATFAFRLFFLQHGTESFDLNDMRPIFETTCGIRQAKLIRKAMVVDRWIDKDFAMCVANNGCKRCGRLKTMNDGIWRVDACTFFPVNIHTQPYATHDVTEETVLHPAPRSRRIGAAVIQLAGIAVLINRLKFSVSAIVHIAGPLLHS
jgi:hypothetical protein